MKITYICSKNTNIWDGSYWRCYVPMQAINKTRRHQANILSFDELNKKTKRTEKLCSESDILVVHRHLWGDTLTSIQHWKARGKTVLADIDLAIDQFDQYHDEFAFWHLGEMVTADGKKEKISPEPFTQFKWGLQMVDGVTVPSKRLMDDWGTFCKISLIPSFLDMNLYSDLSSVHDGQIWLGWKGRGSRMKTLKNSGAFEAIRSVLELRKNVGFMICSDTQVLPDWMADLQDRIRVVDIQEVSDWCKALGNIDVGIAPLMDEIEQRDSWLPVVEYSAASIPWIGSRGAAYQDLQQFGWLVENKQEVWKRIILDSIDHLDDYRSEARQSSFLFGLSKNIDDNLQVILKVYYDFINQTPGFISNNDN